MRNEHAEPDTPRKEVFSTGEAANLCRVSQQTIIRCFDSGRLQGFRVPGSRFRRIPRAELLRFMRANAIPTDALDNIVRRVLVVDTDEAFVEYVQELLGDDGRFSFRAASNGFEAGLIAGQYRPHLILLDHQVPAVNGVDVSRLLRESETLCATKILVLSSVVSQREVEMLEESGIDGFLRKPFDLSRLVPLVESLLEIN